MISPQRNLVKMTDSRERSLPSSSRVLCLERERSIIFSSATQIGVRWNLSAEQNVMPRCSGASLACHFHHLAPTEEAASATSSTLALDVRPSSSRTDSLLTTHQTQFRQGVLTGSHCGGKLQKFERTAPNRQNVGQTSAQAWTHGRQSTYV
jgi:hypothetical protein